MVGGMEYHIETGLHNGISHFCGRIEIGKTRKSQFIASQNSLLVDHLDICLIQIRGYVPE